MMTLDVKINGKAIAEVQIRNVGIVDKRKSPENLECYYDVLLSDAIGEGSYLKPRQIGTQVIHKRSEPYIVLVRKVFDELERLHNGSIN